ncbi:TetR/AcrR family transcriptional regulator [Microlunatus speluncae]|uniref:TetR/AcrR family transcriptional regulator n=1 Tax=Microlunatus speluncae TaxID=2594267 RepID=UPI001C2CF47A|nr:TetR family transcriptional regulator [Microlunatus speluncae]
MIMEPAEPRKRGRPTGAERERRRDELLDAAVRLFVERGFQGVSLDDIAAAARVTKRTIYAYFGDRSEIFVAAVERLRLRTIDLAGGPDDSLEQLAVRIVEALHSDQGIGLHRLMITEAHAFDGLAARFYSDGPAAYIAALRVRLPEPDLTLARSLFTLLLGERHRQRLLGLSPAPTPRQSREQARSALRVLGLADSR